MMLTKGHEFKGPDGQGYRVKSEVDTARRPVMAEKFEAYGGAPAPVPGTIIPEWLIQQINATAREPHQILDI